MFPEFGALGMSNMAIDMKRPFFFYKSIKSQMKQSFKGTENGESLPPLLMKNAEMTSLKQESPTKICRTFNVR